VLAGAGERLRPVLMTAAVATVGMLPAALATGGWQRCAAQRCHRRLGGLILATLLTLFIIPTFYFVIERWVERRVRASEPRPRPYRGDVVAYWRPTLRIFSDLIHRLVAGPLVAESRERLAFKEQISALGKAGTGDARRLGAASYWGLSSCPWQHVDLRRNRAGLWPAMVVCGGVPSRI
jgi:hypothetical protein